MAIRVLLADDHKILRDGLVSLLNNEDGIEVVGVADDGHELVKLVKKQSPDMVILDVTMPNMNGVQATRRIKLDRPEIKILALSMHTENQFVTQMLQAGASGYMLKDCAYEELITAVRMIMAGKYYLSDDITGVVVNNYLKNMQDLTANDAAVLTQREKEILQLIAEGNSTANIAEFHSISVKTVETHRKNIMDKLDLHSLPELTKYAIREGLTSLGS